MKIKFLSVGMTLALSVTLFAEAPEADTFATVHDPESYFFPDKNHHGPTYRIARGGAVQRDTYPSHVEKHLEVLVVDPLMDLQPIMLEYKNQIIDALRHTGATLNWCQVGFKVEGGGFKGGGNNSGNYEDCASRGAEGLIQQFKFEYEYDERYGIGRVELENQTSPRLLKVYFFEWIPG